MRAHERSGLNQFDLYALFNRFDQALAKWAEEEGEPKPDANEFMLVHVDCGRLCDFEHRESGEVLQFDAKTGVIV